MTLEEAIEILEEVKELDDTMYAHNPAYMNSLDMAIEALKEVQRYREIGTIEEIRKMINQGINNCYMSHKYEHPGYEEGMCAGLRTMNGDGEPVYKCKLCRLNYLFERSEGE